MTRKGLIPRKTTNQPHIYIYIYIHVNIYIAYPRYLTAEPLSFSALVKEFFFTYTFLHTRYRLPGVLNFLEELLRFSLCGSRQIPHLIAQPTGGSLFSVTLRQTVSLSHNSSSWLDTRYASSWDRNQADFMSVRFLWHFVSF